MALACGFVVMPDDGQIGFPEMSTGVGGGLSQLLLRRVGLANAHELIITGQRINGLEAQRIGLVS